MQQLALTALDNQNMALTPTNPINKDHTTSDINNTQQHNNQFSKIPLPTRNHSVFTNNTKQPQRSRIDTTDSDDDDIIIHMNCKPTPQEPDTSKITIPDNISTSNHIQPSYASITSNTKSTTQTIGNQETTIEKNLWHKKSEAIIQSQNRKRTLSMISDDIIATNDTEISNTNVSTNKNSISSAIVSTQTSPTHLSPPRKRQRSGREITASNKSNTAKPTKPPLSHDTNKSTICTFIHDHPKIALLPNQYECDQCQNVFTFNQHGWSDGSIKQFLVRFICQQCTANAANAAKSNHNTKIPYTTFKCTAQCPARKQIFDNKHSQRSWNNHYGRYHPNDAQYLHITQQKMCENENCHILIKQNETFCLAHVPQINECSNSNQHSPYTMIDETTIIDADRRHFDIRRIMRYFKMNENVTNAETKGHIIKHLVDAINKIAKYISDPITVMQGLIQYRLLGPTYLLAPYRSDEVTINQRDRKLRIQFYMNRQWNQLMNMIEREQDKHDQRELRRIKNMQNVDSKIDVVDEIKCEQKICGTKNLNSSHFINDVTMNRHKMPADINSIAINVSNMKYYDDDDVGTIKHRMKRCIKKAQRGQWKKADSALGEGAIVDLNINDNWSKTKSKFPKAQPITRQYPEPKSKWHLNAKEVHEILLRIPSKSCGGNVAISNELLTWAIKHDAVYGFESAIISLSKAMVKKAMTGFPRSLFLYSKGLPLGKPDKTKKYPKSDDDVRPVTICDSILRIIDKLMYENIPESVRLEVLGPYQVVCKKNAAEIATEAMNRALILLKQLQDSSLISLDAINAFSCMCHNQMYMMVREDVVDLLQYYLFLYDGPIDVVFDSTHSLQILGGLIQGFATSMFLYGGGKWRIQRKANDLMLTKHKDFKIEFQVDYVDDGAQLILDKYLRDYVEILMQIYLEWLISINKKKSQIVIDSNNANKIQWIQQYFPQFKYSTDGTITFLSVPHGHHKYVIDSIQKQIKKIYTKIQYIERIPHSQIRNTLYRKLFNYNKIIYLIKTTKYIDKWLPDINRLYSIITSSITTNLHDKHRKPVKYQISLSQKAGGKGLRAPQYYYTATKISAMSMPEERISSLFNFKCDSVIVSSSNADLPRQQPHITQISAYQMAKQTMEHELDNFVNELKTFTQQPNFKYDPLYPPSHRELLKMIDDRLYQLFIEASEEHDKARMNSLRVTGASSFLNVPCNPFYGVEYTNLQYHMIQSLYLGSKIVKDNTICRRCGQEMDPYGWHALHCKYGPHMIRRHNAIVNELSIFLKQANLSFKLEQKYKTFDMKKGFTEENNMIPGDIVIENWYDKTSEPAYFDITIGNIFCDTYIKGAAKEMHHVTRLKARQKHQKYSHISTMEPMVIDTMGGFGEQFKINLQHIAKRISLHKQAPYSIIINRLRTKLIAILHQHNANMMIASFPL